MADITVRHETIEQINVDIEKKSLVFFILSSYLDKVKEEPTKKEEENTEASSEDPEENTQEEAKQEEPEEEEQKETPKDGVDLFEKRGEVGGIVINKQAKEIQTWCSKQKFNLQNFCRYLRSLDSLAGWKLSAPLIGTRKDGTPTIFQLAQRYYHWWLASKEQVAEEYKKFLKAQLEELGYTIKLFKETFPGSEEVDPETLEPYETQGDKE